MKYAKVAVESAAFTFDKAFDYIVPPELEAAALPGCRVTVPFGNGNRQRIGIIFELCDSTESKRPKKIISVLDSEPLLDGEMLSLAEWIKDRTFCTLYEAAKAMLPTGINHRMVSSYAPSANADAGRLDGLDSRELEFLEYIRKRGTFVKAENAFKALGMKRDDSVPEALVKRGLLITGRDAVRNLGDLSVRMMRLVPEASEMKLTKKQREMADVLEDVGTASVKELCYFTGLTPAVANALVRNGAAEFYDREVITLPDFVSAEPHRDAIALTDEQQAAHDKLLSLANSGKASVSLLYGVTGSGKTSVYMSVIDEVVDSGRTVIVMVPEIGLTPQTLSLFCRRYGGRVAVFHSALSVRERLDEWKRVKSGKADIVIGTRSAVFAPLENIGLIIVDEEQEHTYKSEQTPRYDAIDVAKYRAAYNKCLLLLASATPSVESYAAAKSGKYELCTLTKRYGSAVLPEVITVDMRSAEKAPGSRAISRVLYEALEENLKEGRQSILLINRRGFHTFAACNHCGAVVSCPYCSISMTYHSANNRLMCHYCGHSVPFSSVCPECGEDAVRYSGFGTQKIESELAALLPQARVVRMDTDSTAGKNSHEKLLDSFANGEYDIMIGTQMVAKGLNFPNVTLVGVVSVDQQLYNDDFRSLEKTFSLLTQVVGRSGRGELKGKAIIQTLTPENEVIRLAARQDYDAFFDTEIRLRRALVYPPYCDLCVVGFTGTDETVVKTAARNALELLKRHLAGEFKGEKAIILGPMPARVAKVCGKFRYRLIIKCRNTGGMRRLISRLLIETGEDSRFSKVTAYADINPDSTV